MECKTCKYNYFHDFHLTNPKKDSKHYTCECHIDPPILLPSGQWGWPTVELFDFCGAYIRAAELRVQTESGSGQIDEQESEITTDV